MLSSLNLYTTMITLTPEHYWKLTALIARRDTIQRDAQRAIDDASAKINEAMTAAGLDPLRGYNLNDADLTATPQEAKPT